MTGKQTPPMPADVAAAFDALPPAIRHRLLEVRALIFATSEATERVGPLTETLKWGEPAYLTEATRSGSTIRLGWFRASRHHDCAVLFHCATTLVETFRERFPDVFDYQKNGRSCSMRRNRYRTCRCPSASAWRCA